MNVFAMFYLFLLSDVDVLFSKVETELYVVVQLCQRNSGKMDRAAREVRLRKSGHDYLNEFF